MVLSHVAEGSTLGNRYLVKRSLGRGGMAAVYLAYDPRLDLDVALKVLPPYVAADPTFVSRFRREGRTLAALTHPYILRLYDLHEDEASALYFLVLEHLTGGTLKDRLTGQPWPAPEALEVLVPVAEALDFAHRRPAPVVHRDLKPANVLFGEGDRVVVSDFGLARLLAPEGPDAEGRDRRGESLSLSLSGGQVMGTPAYMAPEQAEGQVATPAADLYAMGVVAYELLTGTVPFLAETPQGTLMQVLTRPLPLPTAVNPDIETPVERVLLKALAKDPANRFRSARELVEALVSAGQPTIVPGRREARSAVQSGSAASAALDGGAPKMSQVVLEPAPVDVVAHPHPAARAPEKADEPVTRPEPPPARDESAAPGRYEATRVPRVTMAPSVRRLVLAVGALGVVVLALTLVAAGQVTVQRERDNQARATRTAVAAMWLVGRDQQRATAQAATGTAQASASASTVATATLPAAAASPTPPETRVPTTDEIWHETEAALDGTWGKDWPATLAALDAFRAVAPEHDAAKQKLYAVLVDYGRALHQGGDTPKAVAQWVRARELLPGRPESPQLLRELTPAPTPAPPATPTPAPPQAAPSGGSPQAAAQANAQANAQVTAQVQTATALAASVRQLQAAQETAVAQQTASARALGQANADATRTQQTAAAQASSQQTVQAAAAAQAAQTAAAGQTATARAVADGNITATARAQQTAAAGQTAVAVQTALAAQTAAAGIAATATAVQAQQIAAAATQAARNSYFFDDTDPYLIYEGNWDTVRDQGASGGTLHQSRQAGAIMRMRFRGPEVKVYSVYGPDKGFVNISIATTHLGKNFDMYRATPAYGVVFWESGLDPSRVYTLVIEVLGERNGTSRDALVAIDAVDVSSAEQPAAPR